MAITPRHARYPFLAAAREAVTDAGVELETLVATDPSAAEPARARAAHALPAGRGHAEPPDGGRGDDDHRTHPHPRAVPPCAASPAALAPSSAACH